MNSNKGYVIKGRVIDGTLNAPLENGAVVVEGERIKWVGQVGQIPAQYVAAGFEC